MSSDPYSFCRWIAAERDKDADQGDGYVPPSAEEFDERLQAALCEGPIVPPSLVKQAWCDGPSPTYHLLLALDGEEPSLSGWLPEERRRAAGLPGIREACFDVWLAASEPVLVEPGTGELRFLQPEWTIPEMSAPMERLRDLLDAEGLL